MTAARNTADKRGLLLDAAERIIVNKGLSSLTVDDVTVAAGVAKGTFYLYFQSKSHIIAALQERVVERLIAQQELLLSRMPEDDWIGRLETWIVEMINAYMINTHLHDALFAHAPGDKDVQTGVSAANRHLLTLSTLLSGGRDAGVFSIDRPKINAVLLYGALHGMLDYVVHHDQTIPQDTVIEEACEFGRKLVGAH
ncbi:TetR/AcrR family transcriptional regulator [Lentzea sp.]|uniref:TetR/AcrR family transcriptional regulator n=1 Tax=Lentzea sp. TaxID=56099 RepID=UPI002BBE7401|nr:TetR/AcrR family transcriptional regulator [Lentzea sp.]HUQ55226.1 TetR/AcrR family transcriptional regulator [Lentzea sp.]